MDRGRGRRLHAFWGADCGGTVLDREIAGGVSGNGDYTALEWRSDPASARYYWVASFGGDSHNDSFPGGCNDEPAAVGLIRPRITWGAVQLRWRRRRADGNRSCSTKMAGRGTVAVMNSAVPNVVRRDLQHAWHPLMAASYSGDVNTAATPHPARAGMSNSSVISPLIDLAVSKVGSPNPVEAGNNIRWTMVVVTNSGPDTGTGIRFPIHCRPATRFGDHVAGLGASARITLVTTRGAFIPLVTG